MIAILALLVITLPVASHMLARAAARHAYSAEELERAAAEGKGGGAAEAKR